MNAEDIRAAIDNSADLRALIPDTVALSGALSAGRTKMVSREVGKGAILRAFGIDGANAFLDAIYSDPKFRYVKDLVSSSTLDISEPLVIDNLSLMVAGGLITQTQADELLNLARVPDPITEFEVRCAIFADDGTLLVGN